MHRRHPPMRTLYLLRHGKSSWKDPGLDDFDRPLAKRGRRAAATLGEYLHRHGLLPALILCSPAKRTRQTLEGLQQALAAPIPTRFERAIYLAEAETLLRRLRGLSDSLSSVMVIGHNPGLENLAMLLTRDEEGAVPGGAGLTGEAATLRQRMAAKFPTGTVAVIDADIDHWRELGPGCGTLRAFVSARALEDA